MPFREIGHGIGLDIPHGVVRRADTPEGVAQLHAQGVCALPEQPADIEFLRVDGFVVL